jgi:hypothetical protein
VIGGQVAQTTTVVGSPKLEAAPHASTANLVVVLQNDGPPATVGTVEVVFAGDATPVAVAAPSLDLAAGRVTPLRVTVPVGHRSSGDMQVALYLKASPDSVVSTSVPFQRDPSQIDVLPPLVGGLILAVVVLVTALVSAAAPRRGPSEPIEAASNFSFSSSWATNVVGLGALLSTVLASTDVLSVVVAGVSVTRLLAVNVVFGGLVALAPLAVLAFSNRSQGTMRPTLFSFSLGCLLTTWAALGQLFGLVSLLGTARPSAGVGFSLGSLLGIAAAILVVYVFRSVHDQATKPPTLAQLPPGPLGGGGPPPAPAASKRLQSAII